MGRAACCSKVGLRRGPWSTNEDSLLASFIQENGEGQWRSLPKKAGLLRCGKSCRLRWMNYLRPGIKRGNISQDEEDLIVRLHGLLGNRWSLIAGRLPCRTDNEIKNYWNTHLIKKLAAANTTEPPPPPPAAAKKIEKPHKMAVKSTAEVEKEKVGKEMPKSKVYCPKPIRLSAALPKSKLSYNSFVSGSSSNEVEAEAEVLPSAWQLFEVEDIAALYNYSDLVSDEANVWEKVYAEYLQLL